MPEALLVGAELLVVDRELEDDEDRELDEDELVSALELEDDVLLAVVLSSSLPSSSHSATPTAARMTTPATISAMSVFLFPFGG
jgi:hypothetical protein